MKMKNKNRNSSHLRNKQSHAGGHLCMSQSEAFPCPVSKIQHVTETCVIVNIYIIEFKRFLSYRVNLSEHSPLCKKQRLSGVHNNQVEEGTPGPFLTSRLGRKLVLISHYTIKWTLF